MITLQQALTENYFHDERHRTWRRNGKTQTWKKSPHKFRVPVKYGLYGYAQITDWNMDLVHIPSDDCPAKHS